MKKNLSLLLALVLLVCSVVPALASPLDVAKELDTIYDITYSTSDSEIVFIDADNLFSVKDLSFTHDYESNDYYSYTYNDVIILNYGKSSQYAVWRLWIEYVGSKNIMASDVTFHFQGKDYYFSGLYDSENTGKKDNGDYTQTMMIKFGMDNIEFLADLETYCNSLGEDKLDALFDGNVAPITMTVSGITDMTVELSSNFLLDYYLIRNIFVNGDADLNDAIEPTPLTITKTSPTV